MVKVGEHMTYNYSPNNPSRFATNLRRDKTTKNLMWDNANGQDVLIVQTPFGSSAIDYIEEICHLLPSVTLIPDKYTEVLTGVWIKFVTAADKARNRGCCLNGEASTYTVFSCFTDNDVCEIYQPQNQAMISAFCDIPFDLHVAIKSITRTEGFFRKREIETGFFGISFPLSFCNGYIDGDLSYKINDFEIPVTRQMLEQGTVYVYSEIRPVMISHNKGLHIV